MFKPSKNLSRYEVAQSICKRFDLAMNIGQKVLDWYYPSAFFRFISTGEYQTLVKELMRPSGMIETIIK